MAQGKRRFFRITLFTLLFVLIFLIARFFVQNSGPEIPSLPAQQNRSGGTGQAASIADSAIAAAEVKKAAQLQSRERNTAAVASATRPDSAGEPATTALPDTSSSAAPEVRDMTPPYVRAEPGPGLHPAPILISLYSDEPADIFIRTFRDTAWKPYQNPIPVKDSLTLYFKGVDKAGNVSEEVLRRYVIAGPKKAACPQDMAAVETPKTRFCIDRYEWPNKKGVMPNGFVNWYMAYDSCRAIKKRLCTAEEWESACGGRELTAYPYGAEYEIRTCNTEGTGPLVSGSLEECRSFFGVYDLSGNLREWTSTFSTKNERHYQVYGGFWENRGTSRCTSTQYSFFPENKFVTIGFRCCKEAE